MHCRCKDLSQQFLIETFGHVEIRGKKIIQRIDLHRRNSSFPFLNHHTCLDKTPLNVI